jgi:hypothetical protein
MVLILRAALKEVCHGVGRLIAVVRVYLEAWAAGQQ